MMRVSVEDGIRLAVKIVGSGSGDPLVVLPGGPCRGPEYVGDLAGLDEVRRLAVIHLRGTQKTGGLSRGWWLDASDVIQAADALGIKKLDLLGHSAGTRLALAVAVQYPSRVASLTLVSPIASWLTDTPHDGAHLAASRAEPEIARALESMAGAVDDDESAFQESLQVQAPVGYAVWSPAEQRHSRLGQMSLAAAKAWFAGIPADVARRVARADLPPSLVVSGREDLLSGVRPVVAYAQALGGRLEMIDNCGHYPWVEQPEEFRKLIDPWVTGRWLEMDEHVDFEIEETGLGIAPVQW